MQIMYKKFQIYLKAHVSGREMATKKIYSYRMVVLLWLIEFAYEERKYKITYHTTVNFFKRFFSVSKILARTN
uniref:DUF3596 domain-containing protein n=1 Tax=Strongyloides venezuelensis TaxID=75913 RepID=A0A0K0G622_STRVS